MIRDYTERGIWLTVVCIHGAGHGADHPGVSYTSGGMLLELTFRRQIPDSPQIWATIRWAKTTEGSGLGPPPPVLQDAGLGIDQLRECYGEGDMVKDQRKPIRPFIHMGASCCRRWQQATRPMESAERMNKIMSARGTE
ncbi:hypothetical protein J6590_054183 [Homalodisca vitripennis]|nr:hypothetical protein J6590_054183 [Homalodisca vitripennis]